MQFGELYQTAFIVNLCKSDITKGLLISALFLFEIIFFFFFIETRIVN